MSNPQAGWYPDPAGNPTLIRYWDGSQWTDQYREVDPSVITAAKVNAEQGASAVQQPSGCDARANISGSQPNAYGAQSNAYGSQPNAHQQNGCSDVGGSPNAQAGPYGYGPQANPNDPQQGAYGSSNAYIQPEPGQIYPMTNTDVTLRLIAFILNVVSCACVCYLLVPLAWMVPMTVISWGIYKGKKRNTVAFGVCTLLFVNLVSGILLLCSTKNDQ